jgi:hypothetical protein
VRLEGLGELKKYDDLIGNRTRDHPAYSIVPQPTTLPRVDQKLGSDTVWSGWWIPTCLWKILPPSSV